VPEVFIVILFFAKKKPDLQQYTQKREKKAKKVDLIGIYRLF
jgi:hypothetical protein